MFLLPRGVEPYDPPTTVLVQRSEPQGVSTVLSSTDFFQSKRNRKVILEQVDSFQLRDKYLFATTTRVRGRGQGAGPRALPAELFLLLQMCACIRSALKSLPPRARFRTSPSRAETRRRSVNIWRVCRGWPASWVLRRQQANRPPSRWSTQFGSSIMRNQEVPP